MNDPSGTLQHCESAILIDGDILDSYPDSDILQQFVNFSYNSDAGDVLLPDNRWVKRVGESICNAMLGPSDICRDELTTIIELEQDPVITFSDECLADADHQNSTGGTVTCRSFFDAIREQECATWDDREISRDAIVGVAVFSVLLVFVTMIIPALLLGGLVFPIAAYWDL